MINHLIQELCDTVHSAHTLLHGGGSSATREMKAAGQVVQMEDGREEEDTVRRQPWVRPGVSFPSPVSVTFNILPLSDFSSVLYNKKYIWPLSPVSGAELLKPLEFPE